jgi:hypothetical protein
VSWLTRSPICQANTYVGLGLAVVAHIVEQLGGQLRVDSKVGEGSRFSFLIPFSLSESPSSQYSASQHAASRHSISPPMSLISRQGSQGSSARGSAKSVGMRSANSVPSEVDSFVEALAGSHLTGSPHDGPGPAGPGSRPGFTPGITEGSRGYFEVSGSNTPVRAVKRDETEIDDSVTRGHTRGPPRVRGVQPSSSLAQPPMSPAALKREKQKAKTKLRVLIVEVSPVR